MVEAKMKSRRGNGTPHPKGRRRSEEEEEEEEEEESEQAPGKSSLDNLLRVHSQVTQTLHQIDKTVLNIQQLASSNHLLPNEVQEFSDALANIDSNLQDWNEYLKAAAERSSLAHEQEEHSNSTTPESTPVKRTGSEFGTISCSPLVDGPFGSGFTGMMMSPFPQTPVMQSPPRSILALSTISEGSSQPTPFSDQKLSTPEGPTCQSHLVFDTPPAHITGQFCTPETPGFGVSPPRTCRPLRPEEEVVSVGYEEAPSTPVMPSPFRTPGILLDCESENNSSTGSPAIIDDLTASTVKRLGPKGLQERLWQELTIHKADILQPVNHSFADHVDDGLPCSLGKQCRTKCRFGEEYQIAEKRMSALIS